MTADLGFLVALRDSNPRPFLGRGGRAGQGLEQGVRVITRCVRLPWGDAELSSGWIPSPIGGR